MSANPHPEALKLAAKLADTHGSVYDARRWMLEAMAYYYGQQGYDAPPPEIVRAVRYAARDALREAAREAVDAMASRAGGTRGLLRMRDDPGA